MTEPSSGWWKFTFLRRQKSQPKVLYEIPAECVSNSSTSQHGQGAAPGAATHTEASTNDPQLDAKLGKIVDKTTTSRGRHVKVSHSGRFKEKKKVRATLPENPEMFAGGGGDSTRDENHRVRK